MKQMLSLKNVVTCYGSIKALKGVSMDIAQGEIVALIGANGAGKTTTLKTISGLLTPSEGEIIFDGVDITRSNPEDIVKMGLSHVPEGRRVFSRMTVMENLELGAYSRSGTGSGRKQAQDDLDQVFSLFPQLKGREKQLAGTLSGGEQQMLAIGRALMSRPKMLLLDEPSMGLAPMIVKDVFRIIQEINRAGTTVLLVEQNAHLALNTASRAYVLETGKIVLHGESADLLSNDQVRKAYLGE
jgi:branched-chain amino acid transport system ATP-binding protein